MIDYKNKILNKLLDKYERSKVSKAGTKNNTKVYLNYNDPLFKDYFGNDSFQYRDEYNLVFKELSSLSFIRVLYDSDKEITKVFLNLTNVTNVYDYLSRENPLLVREKILNYLKNLKLDSDISIRFKTNLLELISNFKSIKVYTGENNYLENLNNLFSSIEGLEKQETDILRRTFSVKYLGNSKSFESIEGKLCNIYRSFSDETEEDDKLLIRSKHIVMNPVFTYFKGDAIIKVNDETINLNKFGHEFSVSSKVIDDLEFINFSKKKILTIENLTTFTEFNNYEYFVIFLSGFHNNEKTKLLKKIYNFNPDLEFYHFGDIDWGGFNIFLNLENKTGIKFKPLFMSENTLKKKTDLTLKLTKNDVANLSSLLKRNTIFSETIKYMLKNNCKLEQENITCFSDDV